MILEFCENCKRPNAPYCNNYDECSKWRLWFRNEWTAIQKAIQPYKDAVAQKNMIDGDILLQKIEDWSQSIDPSNFDPIVELKTLEMVIDIIKHEIQAQKKEAPK